MRERAFPVAHGAHCSRSGLAQRSGRMGSADILRTPVYSPHAPAPSSSRAVPERVSGRRAAVIAPSSSSRWRAIARCCSRRSIVCGRWSRPSGSGSRPPKRCAKPSPRNCPKLPPSHILTEPAARNTAPAIGWSLLSMPAAAREGAVIVLPSDHRIADPESFRAALALAASVVEREAKILTLGVVPTSPETGFGYLEMGEPLQGPPVCAASAASPRSPTVPPPGASSPAASICGTPASSSSVAACCSPESSAMRPSSGRDSPSSRARPSGRRSSIPACSRSRSTTP
jgi:hypothetical protein